ncbi:alpha/beta hydrolase [Marinomonas sp. THO17]|uniref:alpha/beta fold hydrolase n=1 Tax=Marinomonas sp. THO17 TaxID=3149048 RepID=UPI00336C2F46
MKSLSLEVGNIRVRYHDTGKDLPVLVLLHGIGGSLELWQYQLTSLSPYFRVIALDLPNHGLSDIGEKAFDVVEYADFMWAFLDKLAISKVHLAGNSMGGAICIHMSASQPDRVDKMVLLNAATLGRQTPLPFRLMSLPVIGKLLARPNKVAVDQQINSIFLHTNALSDEVKLIIHRNVMRDGAQKAFLRTLNKMVSWTGQKKSLCQLSLERLKSTSCSVYFVHGRQDAVLPYQHSKNAHQNTPGSELVILENCGHTPQIEMPIEVNDLFLRFLK